MKLVSALALGAVVASLTCMSPARADFLESANACKIGMRVTTSDNHKGTITRVDHAWSYCYVRQDDTGHEVGYLYSLLSSDSGPPAGGYKLAPGVYECFADGQYTFMDMRITGPNSYASAGHGGKYRIEPSRKIVFESGPLAPYHAMLLVGNRIGLNSNGDSFYATSCELNRNKH